MSQVLPAEGGLRRVIGDGETLPDGEVDGLDADQLLALYRNLVLLRTYDERSVVYHRQGRIGTYAIFWNHEAMQAGGVFALEDRDWIFPAYRESAIGLLRGMPVSTVLSWWRGHPAGWWNPAEFNVASICVPIATQIPHAVGFAWGSALKGEDRVALTFFGDGATSEGSFHEGATFAGVMKAPVVLFCNNNQWAISTPLSAQTAAPTLADKAIGYGMPGIRVDGGDVLAVYEATREAVTRARAGEGPTFIEAVTYRAAPHATADDPSIYIDAERVEEERENECVGRYRALSAPHRSPHRGARGGDQAGSARAHAHRESRRRRPSRRPTQGSSSSTRTRIPRRRSRTTSPSSGEFSVSERFLVEAVNDALHVELERDPSVLVMGEDVGRLGGVFRATAGLQERFGPDRCVDTPLAEAGILGTAVGLCMAGWRPVCEMQYDAFSYPALDQLINHVGRYRWRTRGKMSFPLVDPHAVRRRGARTRAARRLSRDLLRAHARREGRDPVHPGRCEGLARRGHSRPRPGRDPRAEADLSHCARGGAGGRARRAARQGARSPRRLGCHAGRLRRDGPARRTSRRRARGRGVLRGARPAGA